ncbi:DUF4232 domain-containing protein [Amycolatopsis sp. 195334CR]|uniref:DUF4232 domain-containing protein n=1 Tax=Amycolatopsis sp. 195334CR TaxID=2814588 RepID=UPI001A8F95A6|nr:DUF4232 domain-containing protein [Amycolatopsis sp. 195334CR]MBN6038482.1 DUF4232 domain-containing protein [Amycolatopsis sp. 195334CR]
MRGLCVLALGGLVVLAGCGTPDGAKPGTRPPPQTTTVTASGISACPAAQLSGALRPGSPDLGRRDATLEVTNRGETTCVIDGYGDLRLLGADGRTVPTDAWRQPHPIATEVVLDPGEAAVRELRWSATPSEGEPEEGLCQPVAVRLEVTPPDQAESFGVPWSLGPVCRDGWIGGGAFTGSGAGERQ